jgi:hypothetical protein
MLPQAHKQTSVIFTCLKREDDNLIVTSPFVNKQVKQTMQSKVPFNLHEAIV